MNYGTGAVMGVPGHDERDHAFAEKFNLPIAFVVKPTKEGARVEKDGFWSYSEIKTTFSDASELFNSGDFNGLTSKEAKEKMTQFIEEKGIGKRKIQYHLRDWSVSRQRYWGTPVPMIHCDTDGIVPVPLDQLPIDLPYDVDYQPKGKAPLASNEEWIKVKCPKCGGPAKRDPETLDTFFDSSWYYYRYVDPKYSQGPFDPKEVAKLMPLDIYFGGGEHTLGHTLYARFFTKFFKDLGLVDFDEFAKKRVQHGIVLGPDGNKMSKSKGNVINPDDLVKEFGTDAVRVYLSFMMPYNATGPWAPGAMYGMFRFLKRVWELQYRVQKTEDSKQTTAKNKAVVSSLKAESNLSREDLFQMHATIKKVGEDIAEIKFNTAVAAMMKWLNYLEGKEVVGHAEFMNFLIILSPFAPHITEELWQLQRLTDSEAKDVAFVSIHQQPWPTHDDSLIVSDTVVVAIQINGKLRDTIEIKNEKIKMQNEVEELAMKSEKVQAHLEGKSVKKVIYVPGKILNFVVG
jgi:leucyl-tRNA synthetase